MIFLKFLLNSVSDNSHVFHAIYSTSSVYRLLRLVLRTENGNLQNLALAKKIRVIDLLNRYSSGRQSNNPFVWVYGEKGIWGFGNMRLGTRKNAY